METFFWMPCLLQTMEDIAREKRVTGLKEFLGGKVMVEEIEPQDKGVIVAGYLIPVELYGAALRYGYAILAIWLYHEYKLQKIDGYDFVYRGWIWLSANRNDQRRFLAMLKAGKVDVKKLLRDLLRMDSLSNFKMREFLADVQVCWL